jgi:hypothetical protein
VACKGGSVDGFVEKKCKGEGVRFTAPSGGKKRGLVPSTLEGGEGLSGDSGRSQRRQATVRETRELWGADRWACGYSTMRRRPLTYEPQQ